MSHPAPTRVFPSISGLKAQSFSLIIPIVGYTTKAFANTVRNSPHATGNQERFRLCFSNREAFTQPFHFPSKTHFTVKRVGVPVKNPTSLYSGSFPASPCVTAEPRGLSGEYHGLSCQQGKQPTSDRRLFRPWQEKIQTNCLQT